MRTPLAASLLAAVASLSIGCAAQDAADEAAVTDEALSRRIENVTVTDFEVAEGKTVTVPYKPAPSGYAFGGLGQSVGRTVNYLGIAIASAEDAHEEIGPRADKALGNAATVSVEGDFPGTPEVVVTDKDFRVLARSRSTELGKASLALPVNRGARFILVRDQLWTKPMTFDLSVGR